jgi:flagellar protein FliS
MSSYQQHALEGASAVDLVVALYDGMIRFLHFAGEAVDRGDVLARRAAVKRALDIILHLQARLRMDVGGKPAQVLSEFYASIFAQILQASQTASRSKFDHAITCVRNVREAWKQVARDLNSGESADYSDAARLRPALGVLESDTEDTEAPRWMA